MRTSLSAAGVILAVCAGAASASAATLPNLPRTIVHSGNGGQTLVSGYNSIDTATLNCRNPTGCRLLTFSMVALTTNDGEDQICTFVDGVLAGQCPVQGRVPTGGASEVTGTGQATAIITRGPHTIETRVYVTTNTTLGSWQANYLRYALVSAPK